MEVTLLFRTVPKTMINITCLDRYICSVTDYSVVTIQYTFPHMKSKRNQYGHI